MAKVRRIFISHVAEEADLAEVLKEWIEKAVGTGRVFVSSSDVELGEQWLKELNQAISAAHAIIVLCSPRSLGRPWVNFEAGGGWAKRRPVVPVCHSGMTIEQLPNPLAVFQATDLQSEAACSELVRRVAGLLETPEPTQFPYVDMVRDAASAIRRIAEANPNLQEAMDPPEGDLPGILVDVSHQQNKWKPDSIFDLPDGRLVSRVAPDSVGAWAIMFVSDTRRFWAPDLQPWGGLILGIPWRSAFEDRTRREIVSWVRRGGRVLLLGFELGDRHHGANLNTVAHEFGLHFNGDIVAPAEYPENKKPYGIPVSLTPAPDADHPLIRGIHRLELANVQTLSTDPGSRELVRLGDNRIRRPSQTSVDYTDGAMRTPNEQYETIEDSGWVSVVAEAPSGLTGRGGVIAIGTWDLLGRDWKYLDSADNAAFVANILRWLAHET